MHFGPFCHFRCKMKKNAVLRPKKAEIKKSEESGPNFFFDFTLKHVPQVFFGPPWAEKMTLSFNFAFFLSSIPSSNNLGVMWRRNQKRKSAGNFFSLDLPNGHWTGVHRVIRRWRQLSAETVGKQNRSGRLISAFFWGHISPSSLGELRKTL